MKRILLFSTILFGCQSASKLTYKAISKDKAEVAKITREIFPCGIIARDTTVITDSIIEFVECPESTFFTIHKTDTLTDTIVVKKLVKVPILKEQKTVYVKEIFEDSAKIYILQNDISLKQKTINKLSYKIHIIKILLLWFMVILLLAIISLLLLKKIR